jgi:hypothetical protein
MSHIQILKISKSWQALPKLGEGAIRIVFLRKNEDAKETVQGFNDTT